MISVIHNNPDDIFSCVTHFSFFLFSFICTKKKKKKHLMDRNDFDCVITTTQQAGVKYDKNNPNLKMFPGEFDL